MKHVFPLIVVLIICSTFISCDLTTFGEVSPIIGVWQCRLNQGTNTLTFGTTEVEYGVSYDYYNINAKYYGIYNTENQIIKLTFTSLQTTQGTNPKTEFISHDKMPKEAILKDKNTIIYLNNIFKRK